MRISTEPRRIKLREPSRQKKEAGSALAVLVAHGRYVLQLRDWKPGIPDPGVWALFGGRIEPGETPRIALLREIEEELGIRLADARFLGKVECESGGGTGPSPCWVFEADITSYWGQQRLAEGQAVTSFSFGELQMLAIPPQIRRILERHHSGRRLHRRQLRAWRAL